MPKIWDTQNGVALAAFGNLLVSVLLEKPSPAGLDWIVRAADEVIDEVGFVEGDEPDDEPEEVVEEFKDFLDTISPEDFAD